MRERKYWDTETKMTDKALGALLRACVKTQSHILDSFEFEGGYSNPNMNVTGFKVYVTVDKEKEFEKIANVTLEEPPQVQAN